MTRSQMIRKAASLPKGNPERRKLLTRLARKLPGNGEKMMDELMRAVFDSTERIVRKYGYDEILAPTNQGNAVQAFLDELRANAEYTIKHEGTTPTRSAATDHKADDAKWYTYTATVKFIATSKSQAEGWLGMMDHGLMNGIGDIDEYVKREGLREGVITPHEAKVWERLHNGNWKSSVR